MQPSSDKCHNPTLAKKSNTSSDNLQYKNQCKWMRFSLISFVVVLIILLSGGLLLLHYALTPIHGGKDLEKAYQEMNQRYQGLGLWIDSLKNEGIMLDTIIMNHENIPIHAYFAPIDNAQGTAIIVHGYTDNALKMMMIGRLYRDSLHYNILLPDLQNHGLSGGNAICMGWKDRLDVMQWIDFAHGIMPHKNFILHGISMGAATVMCVSGEHIPNYLKAVIADCGYTQVREQFAKEMKDRFNLPPFPLLDIASVFCSLFYGWNFTEASPIDAVAKSEIPIMFIHGECDDFVPTDMAYRLYEAKNKGVKELWIVPNTDHANSFYNYPDLYTKKISDFFKNNLK